MWFAFALNGIIHADQQLCDLHAVLLFSTAATALLADVRTLPDCAQETHAPAHVAVQSLLQLPVTPLLSLLQLPVTLLVTAAREPPSLLVAAAPDPPSLLVAD